MDLKSDQVLQGPCLCHRKDPDMGLFSKKNRSEYPKMPAGDYEPVIRCSICTGEKVVCAKDRTSGKLIELMLVRDPDELEGFCAANGIDPGSVTKVY